jgi:hypothetical protein
LEAFGKRRLVRDEDLLAVTAVSNYEGQKIALTFVHSQAQTLCAGGSSAPSGGTWSQSSTGSEYLPPVAAHSAEIADAPM